VTHSEVTDIECIVRRAVVCRDIALDRKDSNLVDNIEQLLVYAQGLLPIGNRFRRDT